jgi:hypothetical protein
VPPKYQSKDFLKADFWRLRGGLDVPKERWVSYPGCERGADTSLPIAWAGWDHLQQATALAAYYLEMKESEGWEAARLQPLLAGLLELVPWLEQWHNEVDPVYGERMGAYYKGFVSEEARAHGFTLDDLRSLEAGGCSRAPRTAADGLIKKNDAKGTEVLTMTEPEAPPAPNPEPLFTLDLLENGGALQPTTIDEATEWVQREQAFWSWLTSRSYGNHDQRLRHAIGQLNEALNHGNRARQYKDSNQQQFTAEIAGMRGRLEDAYVRSKLPHSSTPLAKRIDAYRQEAGDQSATFFAAVFVPPDQGHHFQPQELSGWRGVVEALIDRFQLASAPQKGRKQAAEQSFEQLRTKVESLLGEKTTAYDALHREYAALAESVRGTAASQAQAFDEAQKKRDGDFETLVNEHKQAMENLRKTFREEIALRAPAEYWETKRQSHLQMSWITGVLSFLAIGCAAGGLVWLIHDLVSKTPVGAQPDAWRIAMAVMPLLKDLISIPERVHQGDFVLQLSKGVTEPEQTLRDYVVTPQLVDAFSNALGFIQQAVQTGGSKAAYLHGSFGSGKSHFMAVLNLLLAGNTQARSIPELADVVARHSWTHGRKFLLVPYHMIGARDMESAILGQYAEYVRKKHPDAPVPGFYLAEGLFKDARDLRERMGDAALLRAVERRALTAVVGGGGGGWGEFDSGWDAASFEAAMLEPPNGEERSRLVGDLITQFFSAYRSLAGSGESFVSLDDGLSIMSRHAQALGYDAVILFLDELVLWLASHAADVNFVSREGTKLVKLVEATNADRPVPLVSFVARQRDLRDLVGENLAGSVQLQFSDVLKHWEARFHRITLEDRNLPAIAEKRVLRPVDEAARQTLQTTFDDVMKMRKDVLDTLLTTTADREMFRKVYPFSPALVQTLIAVSAALQRERTALKLMLQLLVDRRADLELGQLIPVGDLYDAIAEGDEPFSEGMRLHFDNAKRLYNQRLLPMLERQHGVTWEAIKLGQADPTAAKNLRNDARLLKTLLLGALVPEVESLKGLTAQRLAALNHGTFRSPIPGARRRTCCASAATGPARSARSRSPRTRTR